MNRYQQLSRISFAVGMMAVGVLPLVYGYSVLVFQPLPAWVPWPNALGDLAGICMIATGAGLLAERSAGLAIRGLLPFLLLWMLTRVPVVVSDPGTEISWFAVGEVGVLAAAALVLFVRHAGLAFGSGLRTAVDRHALLVARLLFGLSVATYGLSHFFQFRLRTISLVPPWLPFRAQWAYLAGAGQVAAGLGVTFGVYRKLAAGAEAAMLSLFTVLVWVPAVIEKPAVRSNWVEFLFTAALAGASWVVADGL
jgi:uncharacterized membrane protein